MFGVRVYRVACVAPHSMFNVGSRTFDPLLVIRQHACADLLYIIHMCMFAQLTADAYTRS